MWFWFAMWHYTCMPSIRRLANTGKASRYAYDILGSISYIPFEGGGIYKYCLPPPSEPVVSKYPLKPFVFLHLCLQQVFPLSTVQYYFCYTEVWYKEFRRFKYFLVYTFPSLRVTRDIGIIPIESWPPAAQEQHMSSTGPGTTSTGVYTL